MPGQPALVRKRSRARILLVEDYADTRELYAEALRGCGYEVDDVADGAAALERARAERPDLVLLDLGLPGIDGFEVAQELRKDPQMAGVSVVLVSAYVHENARELAGKAGALLALPKPCSPEELIAAVRAVLSLRPAC